MEPGPPPPLLLNDGEQRRYSQLFAQCCGAPDAAAAAPGPVRDLLRAAQLPADTLHQITELCGAKHVGYFGPTQFYVALKLIAAAQSGLPVRIESIKRELPLPRFVGLKNDSEMRYGNPAELHGAKFQVPYAAMEKNTFKRTDDGEKQEPKSPVSPLGSPPASPSDYQRTPLGYGYGRRRSGVEQQRGAPCEARQPGLPQDAPPAGHQGTKQTRRHASLTRSLSVDREARESSSDYPDDPWRITEEQREYYVNQFKSLEPDLNAFISGSVAKNFFTKSKLSIPELSYIWELSDADCDGALTLPEFCAAFHLIVARKNGYPLPETLPQTLQPDYLQAAFHMLQRDGASYDPYAESTAGSQLPRDVSRIEPPVEKMPEKTTQLRDVKTEEKQASRVSVVDQTLRQDLFPGPAAQKEANSLKARPRSRSYSSTSIEEAVKRGEEPPTPPPRPQKSHSRASSLDLNKVFQPGTPVAKSGWLPRPPALPPRPHMSQAEQVLKMELQPQLSRTPSQTEENSPVKKAVIQTEEGDSDGYSQKQRSQRCARQVEQRTPAAAKGSAPGTDGPGIAVGTAPPRHRLVTRGVRRDHLSPRVVAPSARSRRAALARQRKRAAECDIPFCKNFHPRSCRGGLGQIFGLQL
ncbi:ralBP1-associated Eps domain-containing protein 2 isoform X2 [Ornithorhynchus anatinus]|uniref:ralBP1-associated Eps domain-containing protein 2 isoform X2 n=1 Tax=Ornithorhynchus anatinus TaxID=9258 RepID=UPI0010A83AB9|nr:ralBP1-associated Eps domain-containing protein 2 isoform X2 [Ornithorhynchus anatinus]